MKIAIAGAGTIVPGFLDAAKRVGGFEFVSIFARETSLETMKKLQAHFGIEKIHHHYDDVLKDDIEAVYVALPNHLHFEYAKQALEAGKHVFLEKPFVETLEQAQTLFALAQANNCLVFEAIVNQYLPSFQKLKEVLPRVGQLKLVQANYSQYSRRYDQFKEGIIHPVFDVNKAGGALMDINVYNIHFMVGLFGQPKQVIYQANIEKGVDTSGILLLDYGTFKVVASGAKDSSSPSYFSLQGDLGEIFSQQTCARFNQFSVQNREKEIESFDFPPLDNAMVYEVEAFKKLIEQGNPEQFIRHNQQALWVMDILETARKQVL